MAQEKYKISDAEIKKAENSMSDERRWLSEKRNKSVKEKEKFFDKYGIDVDLEEEIFYRPGGGYNTKMSGKIDGHDIQIYNDGRELVIVIDGTRMKELDFLGSPQLRNYDRANVPLVDRKKRDSILEEAGLDPRTVDFSLIHDLMVAVYDTASHDKEHGSNRLSDDELEKIELEYKQEKDNAGKPPETEEELMRATSVMAGFYNKLRDYPWIKGRRSHLKGLN